LPSTVRTKKTSSKSKSSRERKSGPATEKLKRNKKTEMHLSGKNTKIWPVTIEEAAQSRARMARTENEKLRSETSQTTK
jgi:hypothetical protein